MVSLLTKINRRATGSEAALSETLVVGARESGWIKLNEVPLRETPSTVLIAGYAEVTTAPAAGEFRVVYAGRKFGWIEFHTSEDDAEITATYKGRGSPADAEDINDLFDYLRHLSISVALYGAKLDGQRTTGSITAASAALTITEGLFTEADVGKSLRVDGAGTDGLPLVTTIAAYVSPTQATLADAAVTTSGAGVKVLFGTDDSAAAQAAYDASGTGGLARWVHFPDGLCIFGSTVDVPSETTTTMSDGGEVVALNNADTLFACGNGVRQHFRGGSFDVNTYDVAGGDSLFPSAISWTATAEHGSVRFARFKNTPYERCDLSNIGSTIMGISANGMSFLTAEGNESHGCQFKLSAGLGGRHIRARWNRFEYPRNFAISIVTSAQTGNPILEDIEASYNQIDGCPGSGGVYLGQDDSTNTTVVLRRLFALDNMINGEAATPSNSYINISLGNDNEDIVVGRNICESRGTLYKANTNCIRVQPKIGLGTTRRLFIDDNQMEGADLYALQVSCVCTQGRIKGNVAADSRGFRVQNGFSGIIAENSIAERGWFSLYAGAVDTGWIVFAQNQIDTNADAGIELAAEAGFTLRVISFLNIITDTQGVPTLDYAIRQNGNGETGTVDHTPLFNFALQHTSAFPFRFMTAGFFNFALGSGGFSGQANVYRPKRQLAAEATWNVASIAAGAISAATTVSITGVNPGDFVRVSHTTIDTHADLELVAKVTAANTVTVFAKNHGAGAIDPASGTLRVQVEAFS